LNLRCGALEVLLNDGEDKSRSADLHYLMSGGTTETHPSGPAVQVMAVAEPKSTRRVVERAGYFSTAGRGASMDLWVDI
jgi:hypothetical protein